MKSFEQEDSFTEEIDPSNIKAHHPDQPIFLLKMYAEIAKMSSLMLQAAQSNEWDDLIAAEKRCAELIAELQSYTSIDPDVQFLPPEERKKRITYLQKILSDDAAIRHITEPRLRQLESFLTTARNGKRLIQSYGSNTCF